MEKTAIQTDDAPQAVGPYSQGIEASGMVFCSGQIPLDPETGEIVPGGVEEQTRRVMKNLGAVLAAAGCGYDDVVKTTIFVTDLAHFKTINAIYGEYFSEPQPARATVQVAALPLGAGVEVEAIAVKPSSEALADMV